MINPSVLLKIVYDTKQKIGYYPTKLPNPIKLPRFYYTKFIETVESLAISDITDDEEEISSDVYDDPLLREAKKKWIQYFLPEATPEEVDRIIDMNGWEFTQQFDKALKTVNIIEYPDIIADLI